MHIDELIKEVRRLASESPDNIYLDRVCRYNSGENSNGSRGCIFGQAFRNLGFMQIQEEKTVRYVLSEAQGIEGDTQLLFWCDCVQAYQDSCKAWSECVAMADNEYKHLVRV